MKLSINPKIKGKPEQTSEGYFVDGKKVSLGYGWMNVDCNWNEIFELVTTDGYATSSELNSDNRKDSNFVSRQLIMVDVDDGMTIQELLNNTFYNLYGAGFYATARHTDTHHRFRIMFITEEPITDNELMKKIIRGLLIVFQAGDISCKDASRLYYGVPNCKIKENNNKILSKEIYMGLVDIVNEMDVEENKKITYIFDPITVDEVFVDELLKRISFKVNDLKGDYQVWRTIAWATCHAVGVTRAQQLMMKYWPVKTKKELTTLKSWKSSHNGPTLGTLVKMSGISTTERQLLELQMKLRKMK